VPPASIQTRGLRDFRRDLKKLDRNLDKELRDEFKDIARDVTYEASLLAPRQTGALAASYKPFVTLKGAGVRSNLPYAPVIEYGGKIRPRGVDITIKRSAPVTRAVLRQQDRIVERSGDAVEDAARRAGWH
jgi:hypothetical protein